MQQAGMVDVEMPDLTDLVRPAWEHHLAARPQAARLLLADGPWSLGTGLRYILVRGTKPA